MKINIEEDGRELTARTLNSILDEQTVSITFKTYEKRDENGNVLDVSPTYRKGFDDIVTHYMHIDNIINTSPFVVPYLGRYTLLQPWEFSEYMLITASQNEESIARMYLKNKYHYNPIDNYDRYEEINENSNMEYSGKEYDIFTPTGKTNVKNIQSGSVSNTNTHSVSGYNNVNNLTTDNQDISNEVYNNKTDAQETSYTNREDRSERSFDNRKDAGSHTATNHLYGNIGITSAMELVKQDADIAQSKPFQEIFYYLIKDITFVL